MQKIYKFFSSSILSILLLLIFAVSMAVATFVENDFGTTSAWMVVYNSWWFELVLLGLALTFAANIFKYNLLRKEKWAILLFHLAFIVIILGAGITRYTSYSGIMRIREGESSDVIISDDNFLFVTITDGKTTQRIRKKLVFSTLKDNDFVVSTTFNDKPIRISYNNFIPDASVTVVTDDKEGKPLLEVVVTENKKRKTIYLTTGEIEKIGSHQNELGFNSTTQKGINIIKRDSTFYIKSPHELDFFIMSSQVAGKLKKDSLQPIRLRTLYRLGDFSFVPLSYHDKGKLKFTSTAGNSKENKKTKEDLLRVDVNVDQASKSMSLYHNQGFLSEYYTANFDEVKVMISYGALGIKTPFKVKLDDFMLERYPGSSSPSSYTSLVTVLDGNIKKSFKIFMNNVLDYKGYRFFQASYDTDEKGTVLSVNHDWLGTIVTYLGYFLMGIGMFFTLFGKTSRFQIINKKLKRLKQQQLVNVLILLFSISSLVAQQNNTKIRVNKALIESQYIDKDHANLFGKLLVQDLDGRIKPINTLASEFIRKISRKSHFEFPYEGGKVSYNVNQTFMAMYIAPQIWQYIPIIKVDLNKTGRLLKDVKLGSNGLIAFTDLMDAKGNYLLTADVEIANQKKPSERSELDKEVLKIDERFNILYNLFSGEYLKIFPKKEDKTNTWFSYSYHFKGFTEEDALFVKSILPSYFNDIKLSKYNEAYEKLIYIKKYQEVLADKVIPSKKRIEAEVWYNKMNLNFWLFQVFFTLGFMLLILSFAKMFTTKKAVVLLWNVIVLAVLVSFLCFTANILLRWYVSEHAPWSNGYEMLVFVAWSLLLSGLILFRKSDFALPLATLFTGVLLLVSYLDWLSPEITNLMPVLKSYWLKIHVATIVSSYAPLALSSLLGAMALVLYLFKNQKNKVVVAVKIKELAYINEMSMTIGLFLLAIGTFLGGVWANESWGRYWAWDPKETWALISLIVYTIVLHLRFIPSLNKHIVLNTASMFAFWSIIMTSFGVNYYLSGLHSYASGNPMPVPAFVYYLLGFMVVLFMLTIVKYKKRRM